MLENNQTQPLPEKDINYRRFIISLTIPAIILLIIIILKVYEVVFDTELFFWGVYPRTFHGLIGTITGPLVHGDFEHIYFNSLYWIILSTAYFYFSPHRGYRNFLIIYFLPGILVWGFARPSYHIGLSGVIYALASFLFFVNLLNRDYRKMAVSFTILFLFSSMIIGIFPKDVHISWESHLFGVVVGLGVAFLEAFTNRKYKVHEISNQTSTLTPGLGEYHQDYCYFDVTYTSDLQSTREDRTEE